MRIPIAILLATSLAVSAAPAAAQETNATNVADTTAPAPGADANMIGTVPPVDGNVAVTATEVPPAGTISAADEPIPARRATRDKGFPWGLLGLLGLVGLLGRRRADRS